MSFTLQLGQDLVDVEAGATSPVAVVTTNRGAEQDRYELEIEGIDPEWKAVPVPVFTAEPGEVHGEKVFIRPPRASESVAGNYPFVVRVRSLVSGEQKTAQGVLKLRPFHHVSMEINPKKGLVSPTVKRNDFTLALVNLGNTEHTFQLSGNDPEDACTYEFESDTITLGPGQQREVELVVTPAQSRLLSSGRLIGFTVTARSRDVSAVAATSQAQLEQRSLLSPATLGVLGILAILFAAWLAMMPKPPGVALSVTPMRALEGEEISVRWEAHDATRITVSAGEETLYDGPDLRGSVTFRLPDADAVNLVAIASKGETSSSPDTKRVEIDEPVVAPAPTIERFSVSTKRVRLGESFVVSWKVSNATKVAVSPVESNLDPALEKVQVTPNRAGMEEYELIAFNAEGKSVRRAFRVEAFEETEASILTFSAEPGTVKEEDGRAVLTWQATNAARVELRPEGGRTEAVEPSGSLTVPVTAKTTFVLTAYDAKGRTVSRKITVGFQKAPPPPLEPTEDPGGAGGQETTGGTGTAGGTNAGETGGTTGGRP